MITPIIIMCQSSKAGFNSAQDNRRLLIYLANQIAIYDCCIIRTFAHHASRCIGIRFSSFLRHRIMIYHRIHIPAWNKKSKSWFSKHGNTLFVFPIRLTDHSNLITICFQNSCNNRMSKRWVIHISITGHIDKIYLFPSSFQHFFSCNR